MTRQIDAPCRFSLIRDVTRRPSVVLHISEGIKTRTWLIKFEEVRLRAFKGVVATVASTAALRWWLHCR